MFELQPISPMTGLVDAMQGIARFLELEVHVDHIFSKAQAATTPATVGILVANGRIGAQEIDDSMHIIKA